MQPDTPDHNAGVGADLAPEPREGCAPEAAPRPSSALDPLERVGLVLFAFVLAGLVYVMPVVFDVLSSQRHKAAAEPAAALPAAGAAAVPSAGQ